MTEVPDPLSPDEAVDLTNCDREPIHLLGAVQGYGCLIATTADLRVSHVSENVQELLGIAPDAAIRADLSAVLPQETLHDLRRKLQMLNADTPSSRLFGYDVLRDGTVFDVSIHVSDQAYVFEFEPKSDNKGRDEMSMVQPLVARVRRAKDVTAACDQAALAIQALTGFDRVMVYKFDVDGTGEVIAEKCKPHVDAFKGLRYPASDIPKQARALYVRNLLRLIADVNGPVSPIVPAKNAQGAPLDLSLSVTRAVSPIHLEYLRNMGVAASMSVSIVKDGALWGLIACHHETPRYVDFERRTALELFGQFFSYELIQKIDIAAGLRSDNTRLIHENLMIQLSSGTTLIDGFEAIADELAGLIENDGLAVFSDGQSAARGMAPDMLDLRKLIRFLNSTPAGQVFATHSLAAVYPEAKDWSADIAGILAIPVSRSPRDYIIFFRREVAKSVTWAGNPVKPVEVGPNGTRLTPRKSFEAWSELVYDTSPKWTDRDMRTAESLRVSLIEVVLKLMDEARETRRQAAHTRELLIAELNHRVRNILNLIQGLVSQSRDEARDLPAYTEILDGRVQALARAHNQLTRQDWAPGSLRALIEVEAQAFLNKAQDRLVITGDAPMLMPDAFSTLALVIHELVTNAAKYGALMDQFGQVLIDLRVQDDGALRLTWRENGGPPVQAPTRKGFGTTIIESTVPYELNGTVQTRFVVTGFEADITIPPIYISSDQEGLQALSHGVADIPKSPHARLEGEVLVLEDSFVIALDASDFLTDNGAGHVHITGTAEAALRIISDHRISFALLDVNLGDHTSLPVAKVLAARGIPFVLATGYGDAESITAKFPPAVIASKPYNPEGLKKAIDACLSDRL